MSEEEKQSKLKQLVDSAKSVLYGMAGHDMARYALKTRGSMEHLFILINLIYLMMSDYLNVLGKESREI